MTTEQAASITALRALTSEQVEAYHEQGYVVLRNVFSQHEVGLLGDEGDRIVAERPELINPQNMRVRFKPHVDTGEPVLEVFDPISDLSAVAKSLACDSRLHDILHDIYGEPAELFKDKLIYKPAGTEGATLHQDWIAWPGFPKSFLTLLVAIDEFSHSSGATEVYPHVHKNGYLSPIDGMHHVLDPNTLEGEAVSLLLSPGDIAIFGCFTPHRSGPNLSSQRRRGYFLSYNARSDGGDQYEKHYVEFHDWIRRRYPTERQTELFFQ